MLPFITNTIATLIPASELPADEPYDIQVQGGGGTEPGDTPARSSKGRATPKDSPRPAPAPEQPINDTKEKVTSIMTTLPDNKPMWNAADVKEHQMPRKVRSSENLAAAVVVSVGISVAAGYVVWMFYGRYLIASVIKTLPRQRRLNPLSKGSNDLRPDNLFEELLIACSGPALPDASGKSIHVRPVEAGTLGVGGWPMQARKKIVLKRWGRYDKGRSVDFRDRPPNAGRLSRSVKCRDRPVRISCKLCVVPSRPFHRRMDGGVGQMRGVVSCYGCNLTDLVRIMRQKGNSLIWNERS